MADLQLYKSNRYDDEDMEFEVIVRHLRRLAAYYGQVADRGPTSSSSLTNG